LADLSDDAFGAAPPSPLLLICLSRQGAAEASPRAEAGLRASLINSPDVLSEPSDGALGAALLAPLAFIRLTRSADVTAGPRAVLFCLLNECRSRPLHFKRHH